MDTPAAKAVIRAGSSGAGTPITVLPMMGGSVPIYLFDDLFKVPVVILPIAIHDDSQHAANENLRLRNLPKQTFRAVEHSALASGTAEAGPRGGQS